MSNLRICKNPSQMEDEELESIIISAFSNVKCLLAILEDCWKNTKLKDRSKEYRIKLYQQVKDLDSLLEIWNCRKEYMR